MKTLHPKIHGAFLALRDNENHVASMNEHNIEPIDLVVVNLYPFQETVAKDQIALIVFSQTENRIVSWIK